MRSLSATLVSSLPPVYRGSFRLLLLRRMQTIMWFLSQYEWFYKSVFQKILWVTINSFWWAYRKSEPFIVPRTCLLICCDSLHVSCKNWALSIAIPPLYLLPQCIVWTFDDGTSTKASLWEFTGQWPVLFTLLPHLITHSRSNWCFA